MAAARREQSGSRPGPRVGRDRDTHRGIGDEVLTVEQAARRFGFAPRRLRARMAMGGFPGAFQVQTDAGPAWLVPTRAFAALGYRPVGAAPGAITRGEALQVPEDTMSPAGRAGAERPRRDDGVAAGEARARRPIRARRESSGGDVARPRPSRRRRPPPDRVRVEEQLRLAVKAREQQGTVPPSG